MLEKALSGEKERSSLLQRDLGASLRDSKEALHREVEIMAQLEQQDEVCLPDLPSMQHCYIRLERFCVHACKQRAWVDSLKSATCLVFVWIEQACILYSHSCCREHQPDMLQLAK